MPTEQVFVVPRDLLFQDETPHGFRDMDADASWSRRVLSAIRTHGRFVDRPEAEERPDWKQVIPYTVVRYEDEILLLERLQGGAEARLRGKLSIGVGGHVNPIDGDGLSPGLYQRALEPAVGRVVTAAAWRELTEEVALPGLASIQLAGFVNDDTNSVGSVHFGLVLVAWTTASEVQVAEPDQLDGRFVPLAELRRSNVWERLETWSQLVVQGLGLGG